MRIAVNYSRPAADLLVSGRFEIDLFKCPDWPELVTEARRLRPVYVHFDLVAGNGLEGIDWDAVRRLLAETETPYVNVHLAPRGMADDAPPGRVAEALLRDTVVIVDRFGPERVIVENVFYLPRWRFPRAAVEPEVIGRLLTWTLDRVQAGEFARPWVVACEYGGVGPAFDWRSDPGVMAEQFPRLEALVRRTTGAVPCCKNS